MIPQMLSSPPPATARQAPPQSGAARDPRQDDADAAAFTLAAADAAQDTPDGSDTSDTFALAAETARAPGPVASGAQVGEGSARHRQIPPGEASVHAGPGLQAHTDAAARADGKTVLQVPPHPSGHDTAAGAGNAGQPKPPPADAHAAATKGTATEPRGAMPGVTAAAAAASAAPPSERMNRQAAQRGEQPPARRTAPMPDSRPTADARPDVAATGTANSIPAVPQAPSDPAMLPGDGNASVEDAGAAAHDIEIARAENGRTDPLRADPPRTELARSMASQLVEAVRHGPHGSTDVALNPEELGRVRLSLTAQDGVLHVSVLAERPETHDLLRRNIGLLQSDFRALGYTDVAFDFGPGGDRPDRSANTAAPPEIRDGVADTMTATAEGPAASPRTGSTSARLDLRL